MTASHAIVQTGRLGDLWFTVPLADHLSKSGGRVEVWYDEMYGNPFAHFPSVLPRPTKLSNPFSGSTRPVTIANAIAKQYSLYRQAKALGRHVIWNEIYPFRIGAYMENISYPRYWYRGYPEIDMRRARSTLPIANDGTILYFSTSLSLRVGADSPYTSWVERNLNIVAQHTGYRVLYVPPPGAPDHATFETWRGDLDAYQLLIARCGIVFGISTSAHVLGQLLGKCIVACYINPRRLIDTIGDETVRLFPGETVDEIGLDLLSRRRMPVVETV